MFCPGVADISARRMGDHQIPPVIQNLHHVTLNVIAGSFGRQQIAAPRIVASGRKSIADYPGKFAGNEDSHIHPAAHQNPMAVMMAPSISQAPKISPGDIREGRRKP